jgi:hypothetical protein
VALAGDRTDSGFDDRRLEVGANDRHMEIAWVEPEDRLYAERVLDGSRGYLTQSDARAPGPLLATHTNDRERLPPRVRHGIWLCAKTDSGVVSTPSLLSVKERAA